MLNPIVASRSGTRHSTQQSTPSSWAGWKDQRERTKQPQIPLKSFSCNGPSKTLNTLIHSHLLRLSLTNDHLLKIYLYRLVHVRNVRSTPLRLAFCCLQWVNNNYDNNDYDVSIALLPPLVLFLGEQGIQATESSGELF